MIGTNILYLDNDTNIQLLNNSTDRLRLDKHNVKSDMTI